MDSHGRSARVLWGLIALVLGVLLLVSPAMTAVFIVQAIAVFWLGLALRGRSAAP